MSHYQSVLYDSTSVPLKSESERLITFKEFKIALVTFMDIMQFEQGWLCGNDTVQVKNNCVCALNVS